MDLNKHIRPIDGGIDITDMDGQIKSLPDDFFESYIHIKFLVIHGTELTELPPSFDKLANLVALRLYKTKIKSFPSSLPGLPALRAIALHSNTIDLNKEASKLAALPALDSLEINGYRGNNFPMALSSVKSVRKLRLGNEIKKKAAIKDIITVVDKLPALEELHLGMPLAPSDFTDHFVKLDRLHKVSVWYVPMFHKTETCPLVIGRTKHVLFDNPIDERLREFRFLTTNVPLTDDQIELLFGIFIGNYTELNERLPNVLLENVKKGHPSNLVLLDKPKGESAKSLREKLAAHGVSVGASDANTIAVVGQKADVNEALPFVRAGNRFITVDHLKEVLISLAEPWLLQQQNDSSNDQLLQLLASNQTENLKVAFEIIETGGANDIAQAFLAAIMLAHPDTAVSKAAEKLYDKYGSQSFKTHAKNSGMSLRKSGRSDWKVNNIVNHPEIHGFAFRLMHHAIASSNRNIIDVQAATFYVKDADKLNISRALAFFSHFKELHFENCPELDATVLFECLKDMSQCKALKLTNCKVNIPASIAELTQLEVLDLSFNTLDSPDSLRNLTSLKSLDLDGTKVKEWNFLAGLKRLEELNVGHCMLTAIPEEVYDLNDLTKLEAKQNQIADVDERLAKLLKLKVVDLSNNQVNVFPYHLFRLPNLKKLLLRSNSIADFDSQKAMLVSGKTDFPLEELNLSRNKLQKFALPGLTLLRLRVLDISHNELASLHDSIFQNTGVVELYAGYNAITEIPRSISAISTFKNLWLQKNAISRLEDHMARIRVANCDLSDNNIEFIHPDFDVHGKESYGRLYWKIRNNPISGTLTNNFGGLYGGR